MTDINAGALAALREQGCTSTAQLAEYCANVLTLTAGRASLSRHWELRSHDRLALCPGVDAHDLRRQGNGALADIIERLKASNEESETLNDLARHFGREFQELKRIVQPQLGVAVQLIAEGLHLRPFEISRWPTELHHLDREYWSNSLDLRESLDQFPNWTASMETFLAHLQRAHRVQLMGKKGDSFYIPGSALLMSANGAVVPPGMFRALSRFRCKDTQDIHGWYLALLNRTLRNKAAPQRNAPFYDEDSLLYGEMRMTWVEEDYGVGTHVYMPTPILRVAHLHKLYRRTEDLSASMGGASDKVLVAAARFLQSFVCIHPFAFGNMSVAMNIVNWVLRKTKGAFLPHAAVDWVAQRVAITQFEEYFARYFDAFAVTEGDADGEQRSMQHLKEYREFLSWRDEKKAISWLAQGADCERIVLLRPAVLSEVQS